MKAGITLAGMGVIGCRTIPLTPEQINYIQKVAQAKKRPPFITAHRTGSSVKKVVESMPEIANEEYFFYKDAPGRLKQADLERSPSKVTTYFPDKKTRSSFHTHTTQTPNTRSKMELMSKKDLQMDNFPSADDLLNLLNKYKYQIPATKLKFSHIGVMSSNGKLMGYYSIMIGNRLESLLGGKNSHTHFKEPKEAKKLLNQVLRDLDYIREVTREAIPRHRALSLFLQLERAVTQLKKLGLKIRMTPMPGFSFSDGFFHPAD